MMPPGWICLHRKLMEWGWYKVPNHAHLFIHLLFKSNLDDKFFMGEPVERGEFVTSYSHLASETGLSIRGIRTILANLERTGDIVRKSTNKFTKLTIVNYKQYQDIDFEVTNDRQTTDKRPTTTKQVNNKQRDIYLGDFESFWNICKRKRARTKCLTKYLLIVENGKVKPDEILASMEKYNLYNESQGTEDKFIKLPLSWLNAESWEDEYSPEELSNEKNRSSYAGNRANRKQSAHDKLGEVWAGFVEENS